VLGAKEPSMKRRRFFDELRWSAKLPLLAGTILEIARENRQHLMEAWHEFDQRKS
jgi:hypothetical protein